MILSLSAWTLEPCLVYLFRGIFALKSIFLCYYFSFFFLSYPRPHSCFCFLSICRFPKETLSLASTRGFSSSFRFVHSSHYITLLLLPPAHFLYSIPPFPFTSYPFLLETQTHTLHTHIYDTHLYHSILFQKTHYAIVISFFSNKKSPFSFLFCFGYLLFFQMESLVVLS